MADPQPGIDALRASSFGSVAAEYDRGRPGYSADAIRWLLGDQPLDVVDLGAGTGKLTGAVRAAGHRVTAVEPLPEMRAILSTRLPDVAVVAARAEDTRLPAGSADAVVAGQAFHWFDRSRAFPEIARILRPEGTLGLLRNRLDQSVPLAARVDEALDQIEIDREPAHGKWPEADELAEWFLEVGDERSFPFGHPIDRARLLDLAVSRSALAVLAPADRRQALDRLAAFWDGDPDLGGRESVELPYTTTVVRARGVRAGLRTGPAPHRPGAVDAPDPLET